MMMLRTGTEAHKCYSCGSNVPDPEPLNMIWTYAIGGEATYCDTHALEIRDPFGEWSR